MQSEKVKIHRSVLEAVIKELRTISTQGPAPDHEGGYAYALGVCNGCAKNALWNLEVALGTPRT